MSDELKAGDRALLRGTNLIYTVVAIEEHQWQEKPWPWAVLRSPKGNTAHWQVSQLEKV